MIKQNIIQKIKRLHCTKMGKGSYACAVKKYHTSQQLMQQNSIQKLAAAARNCYKTS